MANQTTHLSPTLCRADYSELSRPRRESSHRHSEWTKGVCPNCGYGNADVDAEGVLWCPACGYSKKGCYT
jgi:ribosomal protein L37AE/L43A